MKSAIPSEGPMRTSWPALRNPCCANLGDSRPRRQRIHSLRDNRIYRAANTRAQASASDPFLRPHRGRKPAGGHDLSTGPVPGGARSLSCPHLQLQRFHGRSTHRYPYQWYRYYSYGMHSQCNGMVSIALQRIAYHCTGDGRRLLPPGKTTHESRGSFATIPVRP